MIIKTYQNKRNENKYLEVHNDGYYHNSVRQYMKWNNGVKNLLGDKKLHRWRIKNLKELLSDYKEIQYPHLKQLDCFYILKEKCSEDYLNELEEEMRWYEEDATDEDIGECGENLSQFLICVYGCGDMEEWLENII